MNLPNMISILRLLATPGIVWLLMIGEWPGALLLFCLAVASDAADGLIARLFDQRTLLGAYLDPIADKTLLVAIYITLGVQQVLPVWLVLLVVSRDFLLVGGVLLFYTLDQKVEVAPIAMSKINTVTQFALAILVMAVLAFQLDGFELFAAVLTGLTAVTTTISGAIYLLRWGRRFADANGATR